MRERPTRGDRPRAKTLAKRSLMLDILRDRDVLPSEVEDYERPATRGECVGGPRPCPWVSCRHHLFLDVNERTGAVKFNFPVHDPEQLEHSCALDLADEGPRTLEEVGAVMNLTRERARQVEQRSMLAVRAQMSSDGVPLPRKPKKRRPAAPLTDEARERRLHTLAKARLILRELRAARLAARAADRDEGNGSDGEGGTP